MVTKISDFTPDKDYLLCVDSDGCAMDTMDIKHIRCFGPCMVEEWQLTPWRDQLLRRWNEINLYSSTRGINRFKALAVALKEVNDTLTPIEGLEELIRWTRTTPELSNRALQQALPDAQGPCLAKALSWSQKVNAAIDALPQEQKKAFPHVADALRKARSFADVAVVSSANREAVAEEWSRCGLLDLVDVLCCQDAGSKSHCIAALMEQGYPADHILMVGDAPGDRGAADENGVWFYPILVRHEAESWQNLAAEGLAHLQEGSYAGYGEQQRLAFARNLGED